MGVKGRWARLYVGEVDLSLKTSSAEVTIGVNTQETTAWQDTARTYIATDTEPQISINGYVDSLSTGGGGMEESLAAALGSTAGVMVGVLLQEAQSVDAGMPVYVFPATGGDSLSISAPSTGVLTISGAFPGGAGGIRRGFLLWRGSITATGTKTAVDFAAAGAAGGDVYVFVHSITGTATNAAIKVQSASTSGGTYADEATVTFSAKGTYSAAMTGAVDRWLRISTSSMGGATAFSVSVVACVDGVTQPTY